MKIVHVASEMFPFAKVGGLGEIVGALTKEFTKKNHEVEIILPKYGFIQLNSPIEYLNVPSYENGWHNNTILSVKEHQCSVSFIEPPREIDYFIRPNIYGYYDDVSRFIYFSRSALEYLLHKKESIDILHIHDWHTSLCAVLYKDLFQKIGLNIKKIILNIHNIEYQGIVDSYILDKIGLDGKSYLSFAKMEDDHLFRSKLNLLKGGINYSDHIVAVSPSYAREILTKEYGFGLDKTLNEQKHKLSGILNGIDNSFWNPKTDENIDFHYDRKDSLEKILEQKKKNKLMLQEKVGLKKSEKPLICSIGRLVVQKGPALIERAIFTSVKNGSQFILLGSSVIEKIQKRFTKIERIFRDHGEVSINCSYDEKLAHLIYAASDFIIIPSFFEPCGLTQLIALRYGTIPIVRKTGGLSDTVFDVDDDSISEKIKNGFSFNNFLKREMDEALKRAIKYWKEDPLKIHRLIENGICSDHGMEKVALEYLSLYQKMISFE